MNLGGCILSCHRRCASWDGGLYVYAYCKVGPLIRGGYEIVRIVLSGGDDDFELIKFSMVTEKPLGGMHVGRLGDGRLRSAGLDGSRLQVWTLRGKRENEWVWVHDSTISGLSGCDLRLPRLIVGFHPSTNVVLLLYKCVVSAYDLEKFH